MNLENIKNAIVVLEQKISALPPGSVTKKRVRGREYFYHRVSENGKRREKFIPVDEVAGFVQKIEQRKALEKELKEMRKQLVSIKKTTATKFLTNVTTGDALRSFAATVRQYKKREGFEQLRSYVQSPPQDKIFILCGLRRTGKTTMLRQLLFEMNEQDFSRTAFIQVTKKDTLANINQDLRTLEQKGFTHVFLDEVTLMEDFIEGAALFSDIFASSGINIVLSGTDSLSFIFTKCEQLYDRCILLHTTFISYREFETVLGVCGIDEYICYGGTMSLGGVHYNKTSTFATRKSTDEYVDTAIAKNIQHSLRFYQYGGHFRHLQDLYEHDELTSAINRVVEDINHRFTLEVLTRDFKSHDLGISANNLRRDRDCPTDILDRIDISAVTQRLKLMMEIYNKDEQTVTLDKIHVTQIKEYLELLDLCKDIDIFHLPNVNSVSRRTVIAQPGLRYAQAKALIESLIQDELFSQLSFAERERVKERILNEIRGRMMEDIVLLETSLANPDKQVFVLQFPVGEFDMVVFDPQAGSCQIFEIKHSSKVVPAQYRHIIDSEKRAQTEHRYGPIVGTYVLYRGPDLVREGVQYQNVEAYLRRLPGR